MKPHPWLIVLLVGAIGGFAFSAVSTYDFVAHLDRQVHGVHCSFLPGVGPTDASGASDCAVTLMSPFSSVLRDTVWGGIPVSLPAMGVFAFLVFVGAWLLAGRRQEDPRATLFVLLATLVPVAASVVMGYIALDTLDAACKLCIGIYASSAVAFVGALGLWLRARSQAAYATAPGQAPTGEHDAKRGPGPAPWPIIAGAFVLGLAFTLVPVGVYATAAPDYSRYVGACGTLPEPEDPHGVHVPIGPQGNAVPVLEVFDPLCPACRAFERRFAALEVADKTRRRIALFPLDSECNWMVDRPIHPGACTVSEAILCAGSDAEEVLEWAFDQQEEITDAADKDPKAAARMVRAQFPELADCVGSPKTQARLNQSLRWTVDNQLPVLTPQVYVGDQRVCDEDTDLGLDFVVSRLVEQTPASRPSKVEPEPVPPMPSLERADETEGGAADEAEPAGGADAGAEGEAEASAEADEADEAGEEAAGDTADTEAAEPEAQDAPVEGEEAPADTGDQPAAEEPAAESPAEPGDSPAEGAPAPADPGGGEGEPTKAP